MRVSLWNATLCASWNTLLSLPLPPSFFLLPLFQSSRERNLARRMSTLDALLALLVRWACSSCFPILWKKNNKKNVDLLAKNRYTFAAMNTTTLTPAYYAAVYSKLSCLLTKGTKTNYGIFSHWSKDKFAIFESGWVGYQALHFIQIEK